jgi:hypothetical protein
MSKRTVRANARTLPEAPPHPDAEIRALAADFEAAFQANRPFFYGSGTDEEAEASTVRVDEIVRKIVALPTTDIEMMRLKARIYLWSEATDFKTFAAENEGDGSSEAVLVSLFRDLGAEGPIEAAPDEGTMTIGVPMTRAANRRAVLGTIIAAGATGATAALPTEDADRELAEEERAATEFEPWTKEALEKSEPVSNEKWNEIGRNHLPTVRISWIMLGKTKEELKAIIVKLDKIDSDLLQEMEEGIKFFKTHAEILEYAQARLLVAGSALLAEGRIKSSGACEGGHADRGRGQEILKEMLLAERSELTSKPLTPERQEEVAACDRLLERLARRARETADAA